MTADATPPPSDDLTPEVLAPWEELARLADGSAWRIGELSDRYQARLRAVDELRTTAVPALLSGVRSRDARIAEQDEEIATLRQQRHDALKRVTELELALDDRFEHSDHQSAKYYQRMRRAEISETAALARNAEAERILLGGIGQSWSRVVDRAILALRGAEQ